MDISSTQSYIKSRLESSTNISSVTNVEVAGSAVFTVPASTPESTFTFNKFELSFDYIVDGVDAHEVIVITGTAAADMNFKKNGEFTWVNEKVDGTIHTETTSSLLGDEPLPMDFDLDYYFGEAETVDYDCGVSSLQMTGTLDGAVAWSYSFTKN